MSIYRLMSDEAQKTGRARRRRGVLRGGQDGETAAVAETLTRYIPSEAIAAYTSILGLLLKDDPLEQQGSTARWLLAGAVAVLAVVYSVGVYRRSVLAAGERFRWPVTKTLVVLVAFAAWVCVIPGSPFGDFDWYTPAIGAVIGILVNAALGAVALFTDGPAADEGA